jgi:hypothetical protein
MEFAESVQAATTAAKDTVQDIRDAAKQLHDSQVAANNIQMMGKVRSLVLVSFRNRHIPSSYPGQTLPTHVYVLLPCRSSSWLTLCSTQYFLPQ